VCENGNLHLERRALAYRGLDPDTTTMHLHDLLGYGEPEARAALGLSVGAVDLMELLEDASLVLFGNAWSRIGHAVEVAVDRLGSYVHLAGVGELDSVADEVAEHLRQENKRRAGGIIQIARASEIKRSVFEAMRSKDGSGPLIRASWRGRGSTPSYGEALRACDAGHAAEECTITYIRSLHERTREAAQIISEATTG
jgi:hypothetical protein